MTARKDNAPAAVQAFMTDVAACYSLSSGVGLIHVGLPRFSGQLSGLHGFECAGVDELLLVVDRAEVANG